MQKWRGLEVSLKQLLVTRIPQILFIHMDSARMAVGGVKMGVETVLQIVGHQ